MKKYVYSYISIQPETKTIIKTMASQRSTTYDKLILYLIKFHKDVVDKENEERKAQGQPEVITYDKSLLNKRRKIA